MNTKFKILFLFFALILRGNIVAFAQENVGPVLYNPFIKNSSARAASTKKITAAVLPFFEDFNQYDVIPDTGKWIGRQVYINNTMASNMISRGVATFDALSQFGLPYDISSATIVRYADSLTSTPIDLSSNVPSDSIYLSFFYQPGGNGFAPEKFDSLILYLKSKTSAGWIKVWSRSDSATQDFKQVMIPVKDTIFLHNEFQFRFVNKASVGINDDVWNLDYIRMDVGRNINDTVINDVAYTITPTSILNDYVSMPYRQYLANASAERASKFNSTIRNNFQTNQNIANFGYTAKEVSSGTSLSSASDVNRNIPARSTSDVSFNTYNATPGAGAYDKVIFENKYYLQAPGGDNVSENDTIIGQQVFDNYLAYDDGTAEMSYYLNLFPTLPGKIAIEHHLNQADTLRGLSIYFGRQVPLASYKYFNIVVYKNIAYGSSSSDNVIYQIENLQPGYVDTVNHFWVYKFDKPVVMSPGTFYIGTTQPALSGSDSLYIGLDRNRIGGNHVYYNVLNVWTPSTISGALMMRPIFGAPITGTAVEEFITEQKHFEIAPNPAQNTLQISMPEWKEKAVFEIKNLLGSNILSGNISENNQNIDISNLPAGMYVIHINARGIQFAVQKFIKQ